MFRKVIVKKGGIWHQVMSWPSLLLSLDHGAKSWHLPHNEWLTWNNLENTPGISYTPRIAAIYDFLCTLSHDFFSILLKMLLSTFNAGNTYLYGKVRFVRNQITQISIFFPQSLSKGRHVGSTPANVHISMPVIDIENTANLFAKVLSINVLPIY